MRQRSLGRTNLNVSEIALGTVELGLDYGIDVPGQAFRPPESEAVALLNYALDRGINIIDTARAYGASETVIGEAISHRRSEFVLVSKVKTFHTEVEDLAERKQAMLDSVQESLRQLQTDHLDLLLLHSSSVEEITNPLYVEVLNECRRRGWTQYIGASVYGVAAAMAAIESDQFDCLQVAWNLLDRSVEERVLPEAAVSRVGLMVRSVLMRGALTDRRKHLPQSLSPITDAADAMEVIARHAGMTLPELAYRYIVSHEGPLTALVGTAWVSELELALEYAASPKLSDDLMRTIRSVSVSQPELLDLSRWPPV
jgi:aryl-alcohol dehydrogenase-like predicted oxidoreductase